jgi:hypothetical protein
VAMGCVYGKTFRLPLGKEDINDIVEIFALQRATNDHFIKLFLDK